MNDIWLYMAFWGSLIFLVYLAFLLWTLYDILAKQTGMDAISKLIWTVLVVFFPLAGVILYFLVVKRAGVTSVAKDIPFIDTPYDKIEKLAKLRQSGALTEEEFQEQKKKILSSL